MVKPIIIREYFTVNFVHVRFSLMSEMTLQINHFDPTDIHLHKAEGNLDIAQLTLPGSFNLTKNISNKI